MQKGEETKERIKNASLGLLHRRGYKSTSINDILDSSGIKKGTFYFHYESKEKLVVEVLDKALVKYDDQIKSKVKHQAASEQIIDMIEAIKAYHIDDGTSKGCIFGNMALEIGHNDSNVSEFVAGVFNKWENRFEKLLFEAVNNSEMKLKESAQIFSRVILGLIQGGLMQSKISGDQVAFKNCCDFIISLIEERKIQ